MTQFQLAIEDTLKRPLRVIWARLSCLKKVDVRLPGSQTPYVTPATTPTGPAGLSNLKSSWAGLPWTEKQSQDGMTKTKYSRNPG